MNKYDKVYNFRLAKIKDVDNIMKYLKEEWGNNHILANDKEFFIWQYGNQQYGDSDNINFVLMTDKKDNIVGVNGFIKYSVELENICVSSAITKVKTDLELPLCGVELIRRFKELVPAKAYYSSGTNPKTMIPIGEKIFHYYTGIMQQYYMINDKIQNYKIIQARNNSFNKYKEVDYKLEMVKDMDIITKKFDFSKKFSNQGYKSKEFINKRYFEHPIYTYIVFGISSEEAKKYKGLLITREVEVDNAKALRIVDYIGNIKYLALIGKALHLLMYQKEYEYIDLMVSNLSKELIEQSGFKLRQIEDENIIPTYFEPFIKENVNIWYQKSDPDIIIFKADGDQDRPNSR